jgi:hypothetical protein
VRYLSALDTAVKDGDEVTILPAVAGGSCSVENRHLHARPTSTL